jgi:hypothetical protein
MLLLQIYTIGSTFLLQVKGFARLFEYYFLANQLISFSDNSPRRRRGNNEHAVG